MRRKPQTSYQFSAPFQTIQAFLATVKQHDIMYHRTQLNSDGTPQRWTITSIKTWKRYPNRLTVRFKRGVCTFAECTSLNQVNDEVAASYTTISQHVLV
jgi:hypothetical protein